jgi:hypothetical protein
MQVGFTAAKGKSMNPYEGGEDACTMAEGEEGAAAEVKCTDSWNGDGTLMALSCCPSRDSELENEQLSFTRINNRYIV